MACLALSRGSSDDELTFHAVKESGRVPLSFLFHALDNLVKKGDLDGAGL
ncbi:hypothetical protein GCWU000246_00872 [Jonquetella anthropi E3_33 E1]|nr:hypothetical protein GCWU000246_00872 [Jonquetella anthropi E3_33 E1]